MRILLLLVLLGSTAPQAFAAAAADSTKMLEEMVVQQDTMQTQAILQRYKVKNAAYYARLLHATRMTPFERRLFTYKLALETRGDAHAVSSEGAVGPLQLHPIHFKEFKVTARQAAQPATNLRLCLRVYRMHLQESKGRVFGYKGAVWRYSGGSMSYVRKVYRMMHGA